jgi:hypothetical protein
MPDLDTDYERLSGIIAEEMTNGCGHAHLQLVALTLLGTVLMSGLMVNEAPTRQSEGGSVFPENPGALPPELSSAAHASGAEIETTPLPPSSVPGTRRPAPSATRAPAASFARSWRQNMILY